MPPTARRSAAPRLLSLNRRLVPLSARAPLSRGRRRCLRRASTRRARRVRARSRDQLSNRDDAPRPAAAEDFTVPRERSLVRRGRDGPPALLRASPGLSICAPARVGLGAPGSARETAFLVTRVGGAQLGRLRHEGPRRPVGDRAAPALSSRYPRIPRVASRREPRRRDPRDGPRDLRLCAARLRARDVRPQGGRGGLIRARRASGVATRPVPGPASETWRGATVSPGAPDGAARHEVRL